MEPILDSQIKLNKEVRNDYLDSAGRIVYYARTDLKEVLGRKMTKEVLSPEQVEVLTDVVAKLWKLEEEIDSMSEK